MPDDVCRVELVGGPFDGHIISPHENTATITYIRRLKHGPYIVGMVLKDKVVHKYHRTTKHRAVYVGHTLLGTRPSSSLNLLNKNPKEK
jgi:hypothetical protein